MLTTQHAQLTELLAELRRKQPRPEDRDIQNFLKQCEQQQKELDESLREQADTSKQLAEQIEENVEQEQSMEEFRQQLIAERAALEQDTTALDEALSDQMEVLKLPRVETSFKSRFFSLCAIKKSTLWRPTRTDRW